MSLVSPCCKAEVQVCWPGMGQPLIDKKLDAQTTNWYECVQCGEPCDPVQA